MHTIRLCEREQRKEKEDKKGEKRGLVSLTSFAGELEAALHQKTKTSSGEGVADL